MKAEYTLHTGEGEKIGSVQVHPVTGRHLVHTLWVHPDYRGQGLSRQLLQQVTDDADREGVILDSKPLGVQDVNDEARDRQLYTGEGDVPRLEGDGVRTLHRGMGFAPIGSETADGEDFRTWRRQPESMPHSASAIAEGPQNPGLARHSANLNTVHEPWATINSFKPSPRMEAFQMSHPRRRAAELGQMDPSHPHYPYYEEVHRAQTQKDSERAFYGYPSPYRRGSQPLDDYAFAHTAAAAVQHQGDSPLDYSSVWRGDQPERLAVVDPDAGEAPKHDGYFNGLYNEPAAAPGTVAFLDYSRWRPDSAYVHYMATRSDQQNQGHQRKLVEGLMARHPEVSTIDFGEEMEPQVTHLRQSLQGAHPDKIFRGKVRHYGAASVEDFEGEEGNRDHITRVIRGKVPTEWLRNMPGASGEVRGEHRNKQGQDWEDFKAARAAGGEGGIHAPIFVTVDHGPDGKPVFAVSEGNHRLDADVENGETESEAEIRNFGHAEQQYEMPHVSAQILEPQNDPVQFDFDGQSHVGSSDGVDYYHHHNHIPGDEENHWHSISAVDGNKFVGVLDWNGEHGGIGGVEVHREYQRRGIGTKMFEIANQIEGAPKPVHGSLSPMGKLWRESLRPRFGKVAAVDEPEDEKPPLVIDACPNCGSASVYAQDDTKPKRDMKCFDCGHEWNDADFDPPSKPKWHVETLDGCDEYEVDHPKRALRQHAQDFWGDPRAKVIGIHRAENHPGGYTEGGENRFPVREEGRLWHGTQPINAGDYTYDYVAPKRDLFQKLNSANADESGIKAAGIAVIAMDTGRVLMQQRALNPIMCPCGQGVTWDEQNGWQHDDGSVNHDNEFYGQSVSDLLDQGHHETCPECGGTGEDNDGHECTPCDGSGVDPDESLLKTAASYPTAEELGMDPEHLAEWETEHPELAVRHYNPDTQMLRFVDKQYSGQGGRIGNPSRNDLIKLKGGEIEYPAEDLDEEGSPLPGKERLDDSKQIYLDSVGPSCQGCFDSTGVTRGEAAHNDVQKMHENDIARMEMAQEDSPEEWREKQIEETKNLLHPWKPALPEPGERRLGSTKEAALDHDPNEGTWEFPGGKLDPGELPLDAAKREFREEVGQELPPGVFVGAWLSPGGIVVSAGGPGSGRTTIPRPGTPPELLPVEGESPLEAMDRLGQVDTNGWTHGYRKALYRTYKDHSETLPHNHPRWAEEHPQLVANRGTKTPRKPPAPPRRPAPFVPAPRRPAADVTLEPRQNWFEVPPEVSRDGEVAIHRRMLGSTEWWKVAAHIIPPPEEHVDKLLAAGWTQHPEGDFYPDFTMRSPTLGIQHQLRWDDDKRNYLYDASVPYGQGGYGGIRQINRTDPRRNRGLGSIPVSFEEIPGEVKHAERSYLMGSPHGEPGIAQQFNDRSTFADRWGDEEPRVDRPNYEPEQIPLPNDEVPEHNEGDPMRGTHPEPDVSYRDFKVPHPGDTWVEGYHTTGLLEEPMHQNPFMGNKLSMVQPFDQTWGFQDGTGHSAPVHSEGARDTLDNMDDTMPNYIERPDLYHFGNAGEGEAWLKARKVRDQPDKRVRIYRAVPHGISKIYGRDELAAQFPDQDPSNLAEWVTTAKDYALEHARGQHCPRCGKNLQIVSGLARAGDLVNEGYPTEYGYVGNDTIEHSGSNRIYKGGCPAPRWKPKTNEQLDAEYDEVKGQGVDAINKWREENKRDLSYHLSPKRRRHAAAKSPVYKGFIYLIQHERDIDLTSRDHANPDDPDGDMTEQSAWWDIAHARKNPALRKEVKGAPWAELELWADKSVRNNRQVQAMVAKLADIREDLDDDYEPADYELPPQSELDYYENAETRPLVADLSPEKFGFPQTKPMMRYTPSDGPLCETCGEPWKKHNHNRGHGIHPFKRMAAVNFTQALTPNGDGSFTHEVTVPHPRDPSFNNVYTRTYPTRDAYESWQQNPTLMGYGNPKLQLAKPAQLTAEEQEEDALPVQPVQDAAEENPLLAKVRARLKEVRGLPADHPDKIDAKREYKREFEKQYKRPNPQNNSQTGRNTRQRWKDWEAENPGQLHPGHAADLERKRRKASSDGDWWEYDRRTAKIDNHIELVERGLPQAEASSNRPWWEYAD